AIHPLDGTVYIFAQGAAGGTPTLCQSSGAYTAFSGSTTFSVVSMAGLPTESGQAYSAFGIGPDGRLFLGRTTGTAPGNKYVAYSDDNGTTWTGVDTGVTGVAGDNIAAVGSGGTYDVYFGTAVSNASGTSGTWSQMPTVGSPMQPHANDGATMVDPNNSTVVYLTTDVAFGMTPDQGQNLVDLNDGIVAVQVNDFDMDSGKTYGWLASKAGIFHVRDYNTPSVVWSHSFPMGDGAPYHAIALDPSDATGQTAWAGNNRVYHTTDAGATWTRPFAIEDNGYQGGQFDFYSYVDALAVHPADPNVVFVGVHSPSSGVRGGLFYTEDGGATWTQVSTTIGAMTYNAEVTDLLLVPGTGSDATVYVGSEYVSDGTTSAYGVKVVDYVAGTGTTFTNDMNGTGGLITNFGAADLAWNAVDGAVWACGQNSSGEPRVYRLASGSTTWELMPTAGLPTSPGCTAITIGEETDGDKIPFIAIGEQIYYNPSNGAGDDETTGSWVADPVLAYPVGTAINVLFWDELLVGTDAGFYGHSGTVSLPVELVAFDATPDGDAAVLTWRTASETNNAGFEVQHYRDGAWQARAFVEGHGTSAAPQAYTHRLDGLEPGTHRFRLKQIDFDGTFSLSPEVEVTVAVPGAYALGAAYPNPFNPQTTFRLTVARTQQVTVSVYDVLGRRVALLYRGQLTGGDTHTFHFDATGLPGGLYLIDVTGEVFHATRPVMLVQ
ncbi:MAG: T9SS C-terminal target domain-containing protein, partial [Bacteroidetes bacterium]